MTRYDRDHETNTEADAARYDTPPTTLQAALTAGYVEPDAPEPPAGHHGTPRDHPAAHAVARAARSAREAKAAGDENARRWVLDRIAERAPS